MDIYPLPSDTTPLMAQTCLLLIPTKSSDPSNKVNTTLVPFPSRDTSLTKRTWTAQTSAQRTTPVVYPADPLQVPGQTRVQGLPHPCLTPTCLDTTASIPLSNLFLRDSLSLHYLHRTSIWTLRQRRRRNLVGQVAIPSLRHHSRLAQSLRRLRCRASLIHSPR